MVDTHVMRCVQFEMRPGIAEEGLGLTARIGVRPLLTGWWLCALLATAWFVSPAPAYGAFEPSTQDSLSLTGIYAPDTEAFPEGMALGPSGSVFYTHSDRNRPVELTPDPSTYVVGVSEEGVEMLRVGQEYAGELRRPGGMDFTSDGLLVIADSENNRIRVLDPVTQQYVYTFGEAEFGDAQFAIPGDVVVASDDTIWISDTYHSKIQHVTMWGGFISEFSLASADERPDGIALDPSGDLWIAVPSHNKIVKYSPEGQLLATFDGWTETDEYGQPTDSDVFADPRAIGVDPWGVVYVGDSGNGRIIRLAQDGSWLGTFNPSGVLISISDIDIDGFGNVYASDPEGDAIYRFRFVMSGDDTEPPITVSNIPQGWSDTPLIVTLDAEDNANAILGTWYSVDGTYPTVPYTGPFLISDAGTTTVKFYSVDEAQNFETVKTRLIRLDYVKPETTSDAQSAYGTTAVINFTATDDTSGVSRTEYSLNGGVWKTGTTFTTSLGGNHTLRFRSVDLAGNIEDYHTVEFTVTPRVDQSATGIYYDGTWTPYFSVNRVGGYWLASNQQGGSVYFTFAGQGFSLIGSKAASYGIAKVTVDGTDEYFADFYAPSALHRQSVLAVGGLEDTTHSVKIEWTGTKNDSATGTSIGLDAIDFGGELLPDLDPPSTIVESDHEGWANLQVPIVLSASDEGTWVTATYYRIDGGAAQQYSEPVLLQEDGIHTVTFWSVDRAGNVEPPTMTTIHTDWTPPSTTSDLNDGWAADDVRVALTADDDVTGVRETLYWLDEGTPEVYSGPFDVTQEGETTLHYLSVDDLDNEEDVRVETVRIDRTPPTATHELASEWASGTARITFIGQDELSGVTSFEYVVDGADPAYTEGDAFVTGDGDHLVSYTPIDAAGNRGQTYEALVRVDDNAPVSAVQVDERYYLTADISIGAFDDQSGVMLTQHRLDGGQWIDGDHVVVTQGGLHTLEYRSVDEAGNVEQARSVEFTVVERFDDADERVAFEGNWIKAANANRHNGSWAYSNSPGARVVVTFVGTSVDFIGGTAPSYGQVLLRVDGEPVTIVDMYTSGYTHNRKLGSISGLEYGEHELSVEWTGTKNPASSGTGIGLDALDIDASLPLPVLRYEETNAFMSWYGNWTPSASAKRSEGAWAYSNSLDAEMKFTFTGTAAQLFCSTAPTYGIASISVDGGAPQPVDLYTSGYLHNYPVWQVSGLQRGTHTVTLSWSGTKNPASSGTGIGVDAFEVDGGIAQAPLAGPALVRFEETNSKILLDGTWSSASNTSRSAGKWAYTNSSGSSANIAFTGTRVDIVASTAPSYGRGLLTVDGETEHWVDFYSAGYVNNRKVLSLTGLDDGPHTVSLEWTGTKNAASTGTGIGLDAIDIVGTLNQAVAPGYPIVRFEETEPSIVTTGTWAPANNAMRSGGSWIYSNTEGSALDFAFSGTRLELRVSKAPSYGVARIIVDGTPYLMDLYYAGYVNNVLGWSSGKLADGPHTVRIEWTGTKNPESSGTGIGFDAVDIQGTMTP